MGLEGSSRKSTILVRPIVHRGFQLLGYRQIKRGLQSGIFLPLQVDDGNHSIPLPIVGKGAQNPPFLRPHPHIVVWNVSSDVSARQTPMATGPCLA